MKRVNVISRKNLPVQMPYGLTAIAYLLLDKFQPAQWVWGAVGLFLFLCWAIAISVMFFVERPIDVLSQDV